MTENTENQEPQEDQSPAPEPLRRFAILDENGFPQGFYSTEIHAIDLIPEGAVEITDDQWQECLANPGQRKFVIEEGSASLEEGVYVHPWPTEVKWAHVRNQRNALLAASDWTQMPDSPLSSEEKAAWAAYRQALRDITETGDPDEIVWPERPE